MTTKEVSITDNVLGERIKELEAHIAELESFAKAVVRESEEDGRLNVRLRQLAERAETLDLAGIL